MEKQIEEYFRKQVKNELKGVAIKINTLSLNGMPDRMILLPGGRIFFVELKAKGRKPSAVQLVAHSLLTGLGFKVYVADCREKVDELIKEWK